MASDPALEGKAELNETDDFYGTNGGFEYDVDQCARWLKKNVRLPGKGRLLDLYCGDGVWSEAMNRIHPELELFGADVSQGGVEIARRRLPSFSQNFIIADCEATLPFDLESFDFVFVRGASLFNQHDMTRPGAIRVIERWHRYLKRSGRLCSIYGSRLDRLGEYTSINEVRLPLNRLARETPTIDFRGGKFNHTMVSFLAPFRLANGVAVDSYSFVKQNHVLTTRRNTTTEIQ